MSKLWAAAVAVLVLWTAPAVAASGAASAVVEQARADCRNFENGRLEVGDPAISQIDLSGDGKADEIVDFRHFSCSSSASLFCGTGGCPVTALVDGMPTEFLAKGWRVITWDSLPVLLLAIHGSECGGTNLRRCFRAVVWSEGAFRSIQP